MSRSIDGRYVDPTDEIWLECASRIGLRVTRTRDAFATTDGQSALAIGTGDVLDPDDCLAQMIFHELCHSLVEGEESFRAPDWGLDNTGPADEVREHACLRLQAYLADRHGLRAVLAPTTDFRAYFDALPADPLADRHLTATRLAVAAARRAGMPPWSPHLEDALRATAAIAGAARPYAAADSLWSRAGAPVPDHATGLPGRAANRAEPRTCGECAWCYRGGRGKSVTRCRQCEGTRVDEAWPSCARFEPRLDCQECGACCREAYHSVTVSRRDPVNRAHPELVVDRGHFVELRRQGGRCAALAGGTLEDAADEASAFVPYRCLIYPDRPRPCREFENAGEHCLVARRRVGLSL